MTAPGTPFASPGELLARRLGSLIGLSPADRARLALVGAPRSHHAGEELSEQGEPMREARLIVAGWAGSMRVLPDGRRQIFRLLLPGDHIGLCERPAPLALSTTAALTPMETVDLGPVLSALRAEPVEPSTLRTALRIDAAMEEAALLDHVVRLGRQTALERTAHLLLELRSRLMTVGLGTDRRFPLPLTQEVMADLLGLSTVHMNRTLQELRRERLLRLERGQAELLDPGRLVDLADHVLPVVSGIVTRP